MKCSRPDIRSRGAYEPPASKDGRRVPVDCLWPSGLRKAEAAIDPWFRDTTQSTELRRLIRLRASVLERVPAPQRARAQPGTVLEPPVRDSSHQPDHPVDAKRDELHNNAVVFRDPLMN